MLHIQLTIDWRYSTWFARPRIMWWLLHPNLASSSYTFICLGYSKVIKLDVIISTTTFPPSLYSRSFLSALFYAASYAPPERETKK